MSFLTREEITTTTWPVEEVLLPEFGSKKVRVKTLSAAEFLKLAELEKTYANKAYALWWIATVCDEQGQPLFSEADIDTITTLPISAVNRVVETAKRLNFATQGDAEGNSEPIPSAA